MEGIPSFMLWAILLLYATSGAYPYDGPLYDSSAYITCREKPEQPLYDGGVLKFKSPVIQTIASGDNETWPAFTLLNLTQDTIYSFSSWVKINSQDSGLVRAKLLTENETFSCVGTVIAKNGCWSFLKGGFQLNSSSRISLLYFKSSDNRAMNITIESASLQPFTKQQWRSNQQYTIDNERKRAVMIHVSDAHGERLPGANVTVKQVSRDFLFGTAIAGTIVGNVPYQEWYKERFNAAVFENELKWQNVEPKRGQTNYTVPDQMLKFVRANQIATRGHNVLWENSGFVPNWLFPLTGPEFESAVNDRIESLMGRYREEFIHWDVSNERVHFNFYEQRLGPNATLHFFQKAREIDPLATMFMNDYAVMETCSDSSSTVDAYVSRMIELKNGGISMSGIGLQGHFIKPNPPLMRAVIDKLATLGLPIWFTEVDISRTFDKETQAIYLEEVLREGFSHPSVNGIIIWSPWHPFGCVHMCLTDNSFNNLPTGDVVDKLLKEWQTGTIQAATDERGAYSFYGFLGEYEVTVAY